MTIFDNCHKKNTQLDDFCHVLLFGDKIKQGIHNKKVAAALRTASFFFAANEAFVVPFCKLYMYLIELTERRHKAESVAQSVAGRFFSQAYQTILLKTFTGLCSCALPELLPNKPMALFLSKGNKVEADNATNIRKSQVFREDNSAFQCF